MLRVSQSHHPNIQSVSEEARVTADRAVLRSRVRVLTDPRDGAHVERADASRPRAGCWSRAPLVDVGRVAWLGNVVRADEGLGRVAMFGAMAADVRARTLGTRGLPGHARRARRSGRVRPRLPRGALLHLVRRILARKLIKAPLVRPTRHFGCPVRWEELARLLDDANHRAKFSAEIRSFQFGGVKTIDRSVEKERFRGLQIVPEESGRISKSSEPLHCLRRLPRLGWGNETPFRNKAESEFARNAG